MDLDGDTTEEEQQPTTLAMAKRRASSVRFDDKPTIVSFEKFVNPVNGYMKDGRADVSRSETKAKDQDYYFNFYSSLQNQWVGSHIP